MSTNVSSNVTESSTVVTVLAGTITGTNLKLANELSIIMDTPDFRTLPCVGKGSIQGASDLLDLDQVDVAFLQSNVIDFAVVKGRHPDIGNRLQAIAKMFNEEVHVIAPRTVARIEDLQGKRVNFGPSSSGGHATARLTFEAMGIEIEVLELSQLEAPDALREGRIDALCRVVGSPVAEFQALSPDEGLHLLPVPTDRISGAYLPVTFTAEDYPGLVRVDQPVQTAAVVSLLATRQRPDDHPRQKVIQAFAVRLEEAIGILKSGDFHPKWAETTLDIAIPGWRPFRTLPAG